MHITQRLIWLLALSCIFINNAFAFFDSKGKELYTGSTLASYSLEQLNASYSKLPWDKFRQVALNKWSIGDLNHAKIQLLKGGYSADSLFKIKISNKYYVIRFIGEKRPIDNRKIIVGNSIWAGENNLGPKVYLSDSSALFMVMDFMEGRTLNLEDTHNKDIIIALGKVLSKLHNAPLPNKDYQQMSQFTIGQKWYNSVVDSRDNASGPYILKEAYKYWIKMNKDLPLGKAKKVMLHNDPNLKNILWHDSKITLLDWELAGVEDPRKEVAHVCAWYGLDDELANLFLTAYYGREPTYNESITIAKLRKIILLEFAWVGLSSLKLNPTMNQSKWNQLYDQATHQPIETLSKMQMSFENKPTDEKLKIIFLGLIKQFILEAQKEVGNI